MANKNASQGAPKGNMFFIRGYVYLSLRGGRGSGTGAAYKLVGKKVEVWGDESYPTKEEAKSALLVWGLRDPDISGDWWVVHARSEAERLEYQAAVDEWSRRKDKERLRKKAIRADRRAEHEYWFWQDWDYWLGGLVKWAGLAIVAIAGAAILIAWLT
ncbi:hypothetical protein ACWD26_29640 [Streptomyces sp. NPDC002787]